MNCENSIYKVLSGKQLGEEFTFIRRGEWTVNLQFDVSHVS